MPIIENERARALERTIAELRRHLDTINEARETALRLCREIVQFSARTIRAVHRGEMETARGLAQDARRRVDAVHMALSAHPELFYAGYVHDSQKEYVEAETMLAIAAALPIPERAVLGVEPAAYLNGIAEAASESRRFVLDRLRLGEAERAEAVLRVMDDIYYELITFDYPDAITGGLRRTTDALRGVLERTRGDLTLTLAQRRLEAALASMRAALAVQSDTEPSE